MDTQKMKQAFMSHEGLIFTLMFTLIFIVTNLIMIDYRGLQSLITNMDPFTILTMGAILTYLYKNSKITFSRNKNLFLIVWGLYILSIFASMLVENHFAWTEAIIWILLSVMFLYKIPLELIMYITAGALISLPSLLMADITLNESGSTLVLVFAAGLIFMPKTNRAMMWYVLPSLALLVIITTSRTAMLVYLLVTVAQFAYINIYRTNKKQRKNFLIAMGIFMLAPLILFSRQLYSYFIQGSFGGAGVDLDRLTSGRWDPWQTVIANSRWFGQGHDYVDFTHLLHVHNIVFDTLGRYGILTMVLFIALLCLTVLISIFSTRSFNITLFLIAFILTGMFEYNYLFMFVYFSPVVLFFVITGFIINQKDFRS
ncbi:O-antigen ligase family protein [Salinicoccus halodurans]|nr:O-antigen ligase family protein [Salinicoccus halodurans]